MTRPSSSDDESSSIRRDKTLKGKRRPPKDVAKATEAGSGDETYRSPADQTVPSPGKQAAKLRARSETGNRSKPMTGSRASEGATGAPLSPEELVTLEHQLSDPKVSKRRLHEISQMLLGKFKELVSFHRGAELPSGLTQAQRNVFESIAAIRGTDAGARSAVQKILQQLEGEQATQALTFALRDMLRSRGWRLRSPSGHAASVHWGDDSTRASGGRIKLVFREQGKPVYRSFATLPAIRLVDRMSSPKSRNES